MLLLVGQNVFHPVDHAATDFKEERLPANGTPTFQSPLGKIPAISELLLIDVVAGEFWMVHGFALLRCFRHERFLSLGYPVEYSVWAGIAKNGCKWVYYWFMLRTDTLQITPEILTLIARIDEFKGAWRALGTLAPDREVERLLSNLEIKSFDTRDEQEVAGYAEVMDQVFSSWQDIPFTENHIKPLHQMLLRYSEKYTRHRGNYKTHSNSVAAFDENGARIGIVFQTATPFDTPRLMTEWVDWVNRGREAGQLHPLLVIAICIVVFLEIHPFQDGNGRLSRVLTTLLLLQAGYAYVPYSSLESVVEQSKEAYYLALRQTQGTIRTKSPDWQPWLVFFLRSLTEQVARLEKKVEREKIMMAALPELSLQIVEFAREHGRVTMSKTIKLTGASRNTLKQHFRALVERGTLNQHGSGRGVWYDLR